MLHSNESRIKAIVYDFAPSNTVKILDMIDNLPFVENLGTVYSQDSIEEKIIEYKANLVFVNICYKMRSGKFSPDQVIERIKALNPNATIILCKSHIGPLLRQLYLNQGFDFVVDKVNDFDQIPSLLGNILKERKSHEGAMVA
ncbi:hypothetical protein MMU07_15090 [Aquiflexum sp. LQ15W]|uniref:hypothetical protein n=1 Tax=Cognataquiflexum nitidum TaxID=2922272 RepID=UPI001F13AFC7|nr:hypothetical protein [Cognataquiflexum nitidum]MCH6200909.1 hypothetical protein [Cognataquiflexum nitidum]